MHLTRYQTAKKVGFRKSKLHIPKERPKQASTYLKHKSSFFMAALSLIAFVTGNMVGEHGWYAFWKAVVGNADDALIVYNGTVAPIALVPDYSEWSMYGGNSEEHTFRQVPKDSLIPLPAYDQEAAKKGLDGRGVYSVGNMGSYATGAEGDGSHPGVDIRVPVGTPVRSIAAGIVTQVDEDRGGYGLFVVVRHPHMPDPANPQKTTVLYSAYAHLSAQSVRVGDLVEKGQQIALSGQTGFATGPHLHFQIDRDTAPWHPYWPFTSGEAKQAGLTFTQAINSGLHQERLKEYTVHPMLLVQADRAPVKETPAVVKQSTKRSREQIVALREERRAGRLARAKQTQTVVAAASSSAAPVVMQSVFPTLAIATPPAPPAPVAGEVSFEIDAPSSYVDREWITVHVRLLDSNGDRGSADLLTKDVYLRTAYGDAEFKPAVLKSEHFDDGGVATIEVLPRGQRTVVILLQPFGVQSKAIEFKRN